MAEIGTPQLPLGVVRSVRIHVEGGRVILRVVDPHRGVEGGRMEFTAREADLLAGHLTSAATELFNVARAREAANG